MHIISDEATERLPHRDVVTQVVQLCLELVVFRVGLNAFQNEHGWEVIRSLDDTHSTTDHRLGKNGTAVMQRAPKKRTHSRMLNRKLSLRRI